MRTWRVLTITIMMILEKRLTVSHVKATVFRFVVSKSRLEKYCDEYFVVSTIAKMISFSFELRFDNLNAAVAYI